jgi:hypothetical protein
MGTPRNTIVTASLRSVRTHVHEATDLLSEILVGVPEQEIVARIQFVIRKLAAAQACAIEAMEYQAEIWLDQCDRKGENDT